MRKSIINQSEIMTLCGTALMLGEFTKTGAALILAGIFSALARYAVDFQLLNENKEKESQEVINDSLETLLTESFPSRFTQEN